MYIVGDKSRNLVDFGLKFKVKFDTLPVKPYGHDIDYNFYPITFQTS